MCCSGHRDPEYCETGGARQARAGPQRGQATGRRSPGHLWTSLDVAGCPWDVPGWPEMPRAAPGHHGLSPGSPDPNKTRTRPGQDQARLPEEPGSAGSAGTKAGPDNNRTGRPGHGYRQEIGCIVCQAARGPSKTNGHCPPKRTHSDPQNARKTDPPLILLS